LGEVRETVKVGNTVFVRGVLYPLHVGVGVAIQTFVEEFGKRPDYVIKTAGGIAIGVVGELVRVEKTDKDGRVQDGKR